MNKPVPQPPQIPPSNPGRAPLGDLNQTTQFFQDIAIDDVREPYVNDARKITLTRRLSAGHYIVETTGDSEINSSIRLGYRNGGDILYSDADMGFKSHERLEQDF